jgi:hypothetical protein
MSRSKQLYLFNQVYPYIPFHVEFKAKPNNSILIVWRNYDKNGTFLVLNIFFHDTFERKYSKLNNKINK